MSLSETNQARITSMKLTNDEAHRVVGYLSGEPHMADALDYIQAARDLSYKRHVMEHGEFGPCAQCGHPMECDRITSLESDVPHDEIYIVCSIGNHYGCIAQFVTLSDVDQISENTADKAV